MTVLGAVILQNTHARGALQGHRNATSSKNSDGGLQCIGLPKSYALHTLDYRDCKTEVNGIGWWFG